MKRILAIAALGLAVSSVGTAAAGPTKGEKRQTSAAVVNVAYNKVLKRNILVDAHGMTLYAFTYDDAGKPACYTDQGYKCTPTWPSCVADPEYGCVNVWPPLVTRAVPTAGKGINSALLSTARRRDGRRQVVYHGHPLYYYSDDHKPGDVSGQGMVGFWWTLTPKGLEIK